MRTLDANEYIEKRESGPHRFFELLYFIILVNIGVLVLSCLGLFIFGIFPAIFAGIEMFQIRKEIHNYKFYRHMWSKFKRYFIKANIKMYLMVVIFIFLLRNVLFYASLTENFASSFGFYITFFILFVYVLFAVVFIVINVTYSEKRFMEKVKIALFICISNVFTVLLLILKIIGSAMLFLVFPQLFFIFGWGVLLYFIYTDVLKMCNNSIAKYFRKREEE